MGKMKYSFDLSAATDRYPIELQMFVLSQMVDKEYSESWGFIKKGLPFKLRSKILRDSNPELINEGVSYNAGQPMGAYSSWAVFALTHHLIVQSCAMDLGLPGRFKDYFLLGDDILIFDERVAKRYKFVTQEI